MSLNCGAGWSPSADAALLEYVAQAGGPGVNRALTILLDGLPAA